MKIDPCILTNIWGHDFNGELIQVCEFKTPEEKERASEIIKQLKGMTISEARDFLDKVSKSILQSALHEKID